MIFNSDFSDLIKILNERKARFVLVGGLAVLIHGHFRTTKDMDIFYESSEENGRKILDGINEFGFSFLKLTLDDILDKGAYIKLGREPVRIDLFCDLPGVSFDEVYRDAIDYDEEGLQLKVIHINHLIENKTKVGRLQDLDDVKKLKKIIEKRKK
ncbi:MAG TPA: nucleotidyltransferase [Chitinophagaceae bacterium]|nr:nucleotidyltransferase [Chitinophagaceae bacterium]